MMALSFSKKIFFSLILCFAFCATLFSQDSLPNFSVIDRGNGRVVVSWKNPFSTMVQVAVQRSYDSLRRFTTIYSAESPELPQNGFTDQVFGGVKVYYRIFYSLEGGAYFFSKSKRPVREDGILTTETDLRRDKVTEVIKDFVNNQPDRKFFVKLYDSLFTVLQDGDYVQFKDSIINRTKDTLTLLTNDTILLKRYNPPFIYKTSIYVYPNRDGYIVIDLPEALTRKYELIIKEEDDMPVIHLKKVGATYLMLDKASFYHGGWYKFELWEDGQIKEKNKIFLSKDF